MLRHHETHKSNAQLLAEAYGVSFREVDISETVKRHFSDIGHDGHTLDVTFENAQARERTQVLMDIANMENALVIGTGDLSELALGWATYNGDHMSMYAVNASVPKTLVRYITQYEAHKSAAPLKKVLLDILDTPVSPELLPPQDGVISQKTEELVGPYDLHDFSSIIICVSALRPQKFTVWQRRLLRGNSNRRKLKMARCISQALFQPAVQAFLFA